MATTANRGRGKQSTPNPRGLAAPVVLISRHMRHQVIVDPADDWYDAKGSRHTKDKGVTLTFNNYRCAVSDPAILDLVKELPQYTGDGDEKTIWFEDDIGMPSLEPGVKVQQGVQMVGPRPASPPATGWDDMAPSDIEQLLASGEVDAERAFDWERGNKNRGVVKQLIARTMAGGDDPPAASVNSEVPDTFGAGGGVL